MLAEWPTRSTSPTKPVCKKPSARPWRSFGNGRHGEFGPSVWLAQEVAECREQKRSVSIADGLGMHFMEHQRRNRKNDSQALPRLDLHPLRHDQWWTMAGRSRGDFSRRRMRMVWGEKASHRAKGLALAKTTRGEKKWIEKRLKARLNLHGRTLI